MVSAGLAVLSFLPEREIIAYLTRTDLSEQWGSSHSPTELRQRITRTRRDGYAVNPGLVAEGEWGIAAAVFTSGGQPNWALSITGLQPRLTPPREAELGKLVRRVAHQLTQQLNR